jgi:glycosyltransferase involved in cell wall biosynthesis
MNKTLPLVSVIIPSYNHEIYIEEAIRSVWNQTYKNLELIVLDDGSKDNSPNIIKELEKISPIPMKVVLKQNEGVCKTLNRGINLANGVYISVIASDDMMLPDKTEVQINAFLHTKNDKLAIVYSDTYKCDEAGNINGKLSKNKNLISDDFFIDLLKYKVFIPPLTCMYTQKSLYDVGLFDEALKFEDLDMFLKLSLKYDFKFINFPTTVSRDVRGSFGKRLTTHDFLDVTTKYINKVENKELKVELLTFKHQHAGLYLLAHGQFFEGLIHIFKSWRLNFCDVRAFLKILYLVTRCIFIKCIGKDKFHTLNTYIKLSTKKADIK